MTFNWKRILILFILAGAFYSGLNTQSILITERYFRVDNPHLRLTPNVCYFLGNVSYLTFRYNLAIDIIDRNLKDYPYDPSAANAEYRRAVCYEKLGKYRKAITLYEDFLLEHPKDRRYQSIQSRATKLKIMNSAT